MRWPRRLRSTCSRNAWVVMANPGGTWSPSRRSEPRPNALPPTNGWQSPVQSSRRRISASGTMDGDHSAGAVDGDRVAGFDPSGAVAGADDRRQFVLAADDRRMTHDAANIRHRPFDRGEDRRP